jgi:hypothetical protein
MANCVANMGRDERNQRIVCGKETTPGYKYCDEHKTRSRAVEEREEKSIDNVIGAADLFVGETMANDVADPPKIEVNGEIQTRQPPQAVSSVNRAQEVVNKCFMTLDRAIDWEERSWNKLSLLNPEQWRYTDKAGAEQLRSEIPVYERAMDRTIRAATAIAKLNIDAQAVNINKAIRELIKSVVMRVFQRMELDQQQIDQARRYLAEEFEKVSGDD